MAMESRQSVHKLGETIQSLLGWKSHLTSNWVTSVCYIMKSVPSQVLSIDFKSDDESHTSISKLEGEVSDFTDYLTHLNVQRRQILNEFLDLRGNIRVFCRIRPIAAGESFGQLRPVAALDSSNVLLKLSDNKSKSYNFDKVFHPSSSQDEVFEEVEPVIKSALDGYNACIFAYGQTGTGKSFTMEGTRNTPGVVFRAMEAIFNQAMESNYVFLFNFSMVEIYIGNLKDLLVPQPMKAIDPIPCLSIQTDRKGGVEIDNLVAIRVTDFNQAMRLYKLGCRYRSTASTNSNIASSRSHCLIRLSITCVNAPERRRETNKIWFIDLGGSERVLKTKASGKRLDEGKAINLSLSALGDVIHALHKRNCHVPFRNSKLTQVLKDSLGNVLHCLRHILGEDSKTVMLVHVSPKEDDLCETVCSLSFATRVRSIHLGKTETTEEKNKREIAITNLQQKLKVIEDEQKDVRKNIKKLNEDLQKLTGRAQSSKGELGASHNMNSDPKKSSSTEIKEARSSEIPRFMKATVCSSRRKSGVDYQSFKERMNIDASRRKRIPYSHRAESVSFPIRRQSENNSECSISRNSCLVDLNLKSNTDNETEYSHDPTECDIKSTMTKEKETSPCFLGNGNEHEKGKKNSSRSTNLLQVDNWLRLHKNEPTISSNSSKSKRVLAIPVTEKKQTRKGEREEDMRKVYKNHYRSATAKELDKFDNAVVESGRSKQIVGIHIPETNLTTRKDVKVQTRSSVEKALVREEKCSFNSNQDDDEEINSVISPKVREGIECSYSTSVEDDEWCVFSCSDGLSKDNNERFELSHNANELPSVTVKELQCPRVSIEINDLDTKELSLEIGSMPGIHNKKAQRALFMSNGNLKDTLRPQSNSPEIIKKSGIYHLILESIRIVWVSALLAIGLRRLGLDHEFFHGLTL